MIQLIYTSEASSDFPSGEVFRIIEKSAANNARADLCGFLIFSNSRFFQVLEGEEKDIAALMAKLEADPRHHSITVVHRSPIHAPHFTRWRMKRLFTTPGKATLADIDPELSTAPKPVQAALTEFLAVEAPHKAA